MSARKKTLLLIAVVFLVLVLDQTSKFWVKTHMYIGQSIDVFSWFKILFIENNGMAFGMEIFGKLFLSLFRIVAIIAISVFLVKLVKNKFHIGYLICIALVLAGAIGNLIDSAFYGMLFNASEGNIASFLLSEQPENAQPYASFLHGKVVDMLYFPIIDTTYPTWWPNLSFLPSAGDRFVFFSPVFNIADSAVSIGVFTILLFFRKELNRSLESESDKENSTK
ncbi:MAG: lipoprotein signal peptidase [Paludibacteraceae bacterium]|nr:lipoprotein signal peptidase [Paludibacteraceae bacterium]MBN2787613.1 lipoprotein signal peptidase [Paludibacteraceae bacterium]